jgi:AcrR family transcriptional regulator
MDCRRLTCHTSSKSAARVGAVPGSTTTAARTQDQRRSDAREGLIRAAAELIAEGGLASLTLAGIGARAGYSRGIANHHFGTKAQLVNELIDRVEHEFVAATTPDLGRPDDAGAQVTRAFFSLLADLPIMHRAFLVLWANAITGDEEIRLRLAESDAAFRDGLAAALQSCTNAPGPTAAAVSAVLVGQLRGVAIQYLLAPNNLDLGAVERSIQRSVVLTMADVTG